MEEAQRRMLAQGVVSKVKHPSEFQRAGRTAPELGGARVWGKAGDASEV